MMELRRYSIVILYQLAIFTSNAQVHNINFDHIGAAEGLSQSNVLCVLQDSRGFMWFGTWDGLNKYDSYKITVYKNDPKDSSSLGNNYINSICESKTGDLWIGSNGAGLCLFNHNKENFTKYKHDPLNSKSIIGNYVSAVLEDDDGLVWTGTSKGLDLFKPALKSFTHFKCNPYDNKSINDSFIKYIYKDRQSNIWIGTLTGGLNLYNRSTNTFTHFKRDENNPVAISGNDIYSIFEDSQNNLWIGTNGHGLNLFDRKSSTFKHFNHDAANLNSLPNDIVLAINEDVDKNLWISTENGGVSVFNYATGRLNTFVHDEIDRSSISNNSVYAMYRDNKNNMWLGNFSGGVDVANRDKWLFNHYSHSSKTNSLNHNQVLCITEDHNKKIWIGTDGGGLDLFDPVTGDFKHFKNDPKNDQSIGGDNVLTVCEDSKGNIWLGSWEKGITVFDPIKKSFKHFKNNPEDTTSLINNNPWKIFEAKDKSIWIGTYGGGLDKLNTDGKTFTHYKYNSYTNKGIQGNNVTNIFEDSDNELWLGTEDEGLSCFNPATGVVKHYFQDDVKTGLSNNTVNSVMEDGTKKIWIATMNGLNCLDKKTGKFTVYTTIEGLPGNYTYGLLEDDRKQIWISTSKGIACFNPATGAIKKFSVSDGLQSNEFKQQAYCKAWNGMMYFGGINGFNQFSPSEINKKQFDPPLVLTGFFISNKQVAVETNQDQPSPLKININEAKSITLPYSATILSFEFASLNYVAGDKKLYTYMLENFDENWSEPGTGRIATYTKLAPGKYYFKVKGLDNNGSWSAAVKTIELIITPPYWLTWWFRLAVFAAIAGSIAAAYFYRLQNIKQQQRKLEQQVQQQTVLLKRSAEIESKARIEAEKSHYNAAVTNKALVLKNKELEQFAYVASHDLQEPLRTTAGFAELLQKQYAGRLDEKADKYLHFITDATERMKTLIKDLLDFSRIGTALELTLVNCNELVQEMLEDISTAVTEADANVTCGELPALYGYPTELKLLFQNLVLNAIKFLRKDVKPVIKIAAVKIDSYWEFTVSDNGIGIEMEYSERIFQIFQRLHTRTEYTGSGIGLSHCKKIVEIHHGKIWLQSTPGNGSTFFFIIPGKLKIA